MKQCNIMIEVNTLRVNLKKEYSITFTYSFNMKSCPNSCFSIYSQVSNMKFYLLTPIVNRNMIILAYFYFYFLKIRHFYCKCNKKNKTKQSKTNREHKPYPQRNRAKSTAKGLITNKRFHFTFLSPTNQKRRLVDTWKRYTIYPSTSL